MNKYTLILTLLISTPAFAVSYEGVDCLDLWDDQEKYQECIHDQDSFTVDGIAKSIENFFQDLANPEEETEE